MALKQHAKGFTDDLDELTEQQLRSFLAEELDSEDVDYELIKNITDVLATKTNAKPIDAEAAYQQFVSQYADTDPLYDELVQEIGRLDTLEVQSGFSQDKESKQPRKVVRFSRLAKIGILVAAVLVVFLAVSIVASAMGFNIWEASVGWNQDNMGVSSVDGKAMPKGEDPYSRVRTTLINKGVSESVVPKYIPDGYVLIDFSARESTERSAYMAVFQKEEQSFYLRYTTNLLEYNEFFPKNEDEPEICLVNGIEHFITSNEGAYRAVWACGDVVCEIYGIQDKGELLSIINSIYKE